MVESTLPGYYSAELMKFLFTLLFSLCFTSIATAQSACYENEKNVSTKKMFTEDEWNSAISEWDSQEPQDPGLLKLFAAWNVYKKEAPAVKKIKGDKRKHCYIGCRIAQEVSYDTALYVAWMKEKEDITDCDASTLFEWRDFEVTVHGAELAKDSSNEKYCLDQCTQIQRYR